MHQTKTAKMYCMISFLIVEILLIVACATEHAFEKSSNLCERCICNTSDDKQTLYINCVNTTMQHTIANWPDHPENLVASFSNNELVTLEAMPGSGAKDIKLVFSNCKIKYLETGLFESCINVTYVDLSHNSIGSEELSADVFKGPYNNLEYEPIALEYLDLSYNQIHSLQKNLFEHTPNLKILNLEGNAMRIIDHVSCLALSKIINIQVLNLAKNRLTELPADAIKQFVHLNDINLSFNELNFVPESLGFAASSLQILNISHNPIIEFDHGSFLGMENLQKLFAKNLYKLTQVRARAFTPLKSLKVLMLSYNKQLQEISGEAFDKINHLEEIYLNDNSLTTLSARLLQWSSLKIINIGNNNFVCNCDLFQITTQLQGILKSGKLVPYCINQRTSLTMDVNLLTNETCSLKSEKSRRGTPYINRSFKAMRITLIILIMVVVLGASVAICLGYSKWKTYVRSLRYPFPNQIMYSPVATTEASRF